MKPTASLPLLLTAFCIAATGASAETTTSGKIALISADPDDFVVQLDTNGECGSAYFHFQRANKNFRESVALMLTAYSTGSTVTAFVSGCNSDRNMTSHAYIGR